MNSLQNDIDQAFTDHLKNKDKLTNSVEDNWIFFKDTILNSVNKHVPQKTISGKQDVPWMNHTIKRLIRKRQRRYNTAKNYDTSENWKKYRKARDIVKQTMTEAHDKYIRGILNEDSTNEEQKKPTMGKKFWQYIKSRKKDTVNISTLKNSSGTEVIDSKGKAAILNEQYDSVFTDEDMNTMPSLGNSNIEDIEILRVTENGVTKLLKKLDTSKAIGPDMIPTRILKEAADQISPFLTYIFNQTLTSGTVPSDWKLANIYNYKLRVDINLNI
ncbi:uncharacterized protein [Mytilus edulis]|uniref:uncharacterized protein n=1 Tax=Mytilus edulis TaxID=6550 RepID=UPI0039EEFC1E